MKYFINEKERKESNSTCYLEFQRGYYRDACWLQDSISISDTLWDEMKLSKLFNDVIGNFDYYGLNVITKKQWDEVVKLSQKSNSIWCEVIAEAIPWVNLCFEENDVFTIIGM